MNLQEYFRYHPVTTDTRKQKHDNVNAAALAFAEVCFDAIASEEYQKQVLFLIQQARMMANQGIVVDELS